MNTKGHYYDWVLALGVKDRNKMVERMQLTPEEKTTLVNAVRKYKQYLSKRKYYAKLKSKGLKRLGGGEE